MDKIKESFDRLPIAVCFFGKDGIVRLVNHQMLAVMNDLRPDGIQTLTELEAVLTNPPEHVSKPNPQLPVYRLSDGKILHFTREEIVTKDGKKYTQITASDVTELTHRQAELMDENERLEKANARLRALFEEMPKLIREEETLAVKQRIHDDIGHSILVARRTLLRQAGLAEIQSCASLWEDSIAVLYRSNQMRAESDALEEAMGKAREMGVQVLTEGKAPGAPAIRWLFALAITECASNCVRHADGTRLNVCFESDHEHIRLTVTNNGRPPQEKIREGGGLSMLRTRIQETGGHMEILSSPRFTLIINLPQEELISNERNDC